MWIFNFLACPKLPSQAELCSGSSAKTTAMTVGQIACADLIKGNRVVPIVHDGLWKVRRPLTVWPGEIADDVGRAIWRLPDVAAVNVMGKVKLPAGCVLMQKVHGPAPVHIIRLVAPRPFLTDVIGGDDVGEVRKGL